MGNFILELSGGAKGLRGKIEPRGCAVRPLQ